MLTLLASLALVLPQEPAAMQQFAELAKQAAAAESYSFALAVETDGGFGGGRGGERPGGGPEAAPGGERGPEGAPGGPRPTPRIQGQFQKGRPLHLEVGGTEAYRDGGDMVYRNAEGKWELFDPRAMYGRRGGRGPAGVAPNQGGGPGGPGGMDQSMRSVFAMRGAFAPLDFLHGAEKKVADVSRKQEGELVVYSGALTPFGAEALSSMGGRGGRGGYRGGSELQHSGSFQITVNAAGMIESMAFDTKAKGSFGDREVERTRKITVGISDFNATRVEVPKEAMSAFTEPDPGEEV